ncbi:HD domain-containing protein [archaeon]|jgi:hypothetical protein|nr:HD domain-containing protein [archaeon]
MEDDEPPSRLNGCYSELGISLEDEKSIECYLGLLFKHSPVTYEHSVRVGEMCFGLGDFAREFRDYENLNLRELFCAGLLHDIGKLRNDSDILEEPWSYRGQHIEEVKKHPSEGYKILTLGQREGLDCEGLRNYRVSGLACLLHHESQKDFYPNLEEVLGLKLDFFEKEEVERAIEYSKLIALVDSYDSMVYKNGHFPHEKAMGKLIDGARSKEQELLRTMMVRERDKEIFWNLCVVV